MRKLVPYDHEIRVNCQNILPNKYVHQDCSVGCVACMSCVKVCLTDAAQVKNNLSSIDSEMCIQYGLCVEAYPTNCLMGQKVEGELEQWEKRIVRIMSDRKINLARVKAFGEGAGRQN